jgi:hypothetical protein
MKMIQQFLRLTLVISKWLFSLLKRNYLRVQYAFKAKAETKAKAFYQKRKQATAPSARLYVAQYQYRSREDIMALFKHLNLIYIGQLQFSADCQMLANMDQADYLPYRDHKALLDKMTLLYSNAILDEKIVPLYIRWINDKVGYGCFADEDIPPHTLIGEYSGEVQRHSPSNSTTWSWSYPSHGDFCAAYAEKYQLIATNMGNELRFFNHSDRPNCQSRFVFIGGSWRVLYVSSRLIKKHEEITTNYGEKYWLKRKKLRL